MIPTDIKSYAIPTIVITEDPPTRDQRWRKEEDSLFFQMWLLQKEPRIRKIGIDSCPESKLRSKRHELYAWQTIL